MSRSMLHIAWFLAVVVGMGCHHCGEQSGLFSRFKKSTDSKLPVTEDKDLCDPCKNGASQASRGRTGMMNGQPVSWNDTGMPYGSIMPSYPQGTTFPSLPAAPVTGNELPPPGGYQPIPSPGIPSSPYAVPRPADSSLQTVPRGGALSTADSKK